MGALDTFSRAFSVVAENKRLYALVLATLLIASLIGWTLGLASISNEKALEHNVEKRGNVVITEYGSTIPSEDATLVVKALLYLLLIVVALSTVQYGVIKGFNRSLSGEEYSLEELLVAGLKHVPGVIILNVMGLLLVLVVVFGFVVILALLALIIPPLAIAGALLLLVFIPMAITYFTILVPAYVETEKISVFIDAFKLVMKNVRSSIGFGLLLLLLILGVAMVMTPVVAILTLASSTNSIVVSLVEAPFTAFIEVFSWAAGLLLYHDFIGTKRKEEEFLY
jgi:hypothetical protein